MITVKLQARKNSEGCKGNKRGSAAVMILHLWVLSEKTKRSVSVHAALASHTGVVRTRVPSSSGQCNHSLLWILGER